MGLCMGVSTWPQVKSIELGGSFVVCVGSAGPAGQSAVYLISDMS